MATRTSLTQPSISTAQVDGLSPRSQVLSPTPYQMVDDQQYILGRRQVLVSDVFSPLYYEDAAATTWITVKRYFIPAPNFCGSETVLGDFYDAQLAIRGWDASDNDFRYGVYKASTSSWVYNTQTGYLTSNARWRGYLDIDFMPLDGSEFELIIGLYPTTNGQDLYLDGVMLLSEYANIVMEF